MFRHHLSLLIVSLLFAHTAAAFAEPEPILLWPNGAPDAKGDQPGDKPQLFVHPAPKDKAVGAAVVICPGGGYGATMMSYEGHEVAEWFSTFGVTGVVLKYRVGQHGGHPRPLNDVQRAIRYVRANAKKLGVDPDRIGVMGFSAGGHLAASAATLYKDGNKESDDPLGRVSTRPNFAVLAYPVITMTDPHTHAGSRRNLLGEKPDDASVKAMSLETRVTKNTPPVFLFHTTTDNVVPVENSLLFFAACRAAGVPAELHVYRTGPHGVGLFRHEATKAWPGQLKDWMKHLGVLEKK